VSPDHSAIETSSRLRIRSLPRTGRRRINLLRKETGPHLGSRLCPFRPGLRRGAWEDPTGAGRGRGGRSTPRRHQPPHVWIQYDVHWSSHLTAVAAQAASQAARVGGSVQRLWHSAAFLWHCPSHPSRHCPKQLGSGRQRSRQRRRAPWSFPWHWRWQSATVVTTGSPNRSAAPTPARRRSVWRRDRAWLNVRTSVSKRSESKMTSSVPDAPEDPLRALRWYPLSRKRKVRHRGAGDQNPTRTGWITV